MNVRGIRSLVLAAGLAVSAVAVASPNVVSAAGAFAPLAAPQRIADTRPDGETVDNQFEKTGIQAANTAMELQVGGRANVPSNADAAVLNVTVVGATGPGFITVYPCNQTRPLSSNVNYQPGEVIANAVFAKLDPTGKICVYTLAPAHIIVDVTGSLPVGAFNALPAPKRIADTRSDGDTVDDINQGTGKVAGGTALEIQVGGRATIAANAKTAVLNVTVTEPEGGGFITVYPCDQERPLSSNLNYRPGQVTANSVAAKLDATGKTCVYTHARAHVVVDVTGTLPEETFVPLVAPQRLVDTRPDGETIDNNVEKIGYLRTENTLQFPIGGRANIPVGATAVILNITAINAKGPGFLTLHPRNSDRPNASNLNFPQSDVAANTVIAPLGGGGKVCLFASTDVETIVDVAGYFTGPVPVDSGVNCPIEYKPGNYPVGEYQFIPGRYIVTTVDSDVCEFYRRPTDSFLGGQLGSVITFGAGRMIVDVKPTDPFVEYRFDRCAALKPYVPKQIPTPESTFGPGIHHVGQHIVPGTYQASRNPNMVCGIQRLSSFDGAPSSRIENIFETTANTVTITIQPTDVGVLTGNGCSTWTRIG